MKLAELFTAYPYALGKEQKTPVLTRLLQELTVHHQTACARYGRILASLPGATATGNPLADIPMLPVRLFKLLDLKSVEDAAIIKTLTSSGTTSQLVSRIFLDKETALLQTKALSSIICSFVGKQRLPMILVDSPDVIADRASYSARGAGLQGLSFFGRDHLHLLDTEMQIRHQAFEQFLARHAGERILIFGFTYMIWQYFYAAFAQHHLAAELDKAMLIHSGGWKKLHQEAVDNHTFKERIGTVLGIRNIANFYGMVEQVGSIYMECPEGVLHAPDFAHIIVRDPATLVPLPPGQQGLVQTLSALPHSYPGHSLLTEDLGTIHGEDDCPCGRKGVYFSIQGRLPAAELRGCSDTHAFGGRS